MDFVAMEIWAGLTASGQAHTALPGASDTQRPQRITRQNSVPRTTPTTAWHTWLRSFLDDHMAAAGLEKGSMWAFAVAQALRSAARSLSLIHI